MTGKNRIMMYGPKENGTYAVEFRTADGDVSQSQSLQLRRPC
jgi:hypothetical protein